VVRGGGAVVGVGGAMGVGVWGCGGCGVCGCVGVGVGGGFPLRSNIPRSALCATLDTYNFYFNFFLQIVQYPCHRRSYNVKVGVFLV
jgi:hypothetical protein